MAEPRVSTKRLRTIRAQLSDRDMAILRIIDEHHFLTTRHIREWLFIDHQSPTAALRACHRVLIRLFEHRLIGRFERPVGGKRAGSGSFVWYIDIIGDRLLASSLMDDQTGNHHSRPRRRFYDPTETFLAHTLAIADAHLEIEEAQRRGLLTLEQVETEPRSWRRYLGNSGEQRILKPDLSFVTAPPDGSYEEHWYLEVDRGTESIPTLIKQCLAYEVYRRTGQEQHRRGVFPRVLWLLPSAQRVLALVEAISASRHLDPELYTVITAAELLTTLIGEVVPTQPKGPP